MWSIYSSLYNKKNNVNIHQFFKPSPWTKVSFNKCFLGQKSYWINYVSWTKNYLDICPLDKCLNTLHFNCDKELKKRWYNLVHLFIFPSLRLSICPSVCLSVRPSFCPSFFFFSVFRICCLFGADVEIMVDLRILVPRKFLGKLPLFCHENEIFAKITSIMSRKWNVGKNYRYLFPGLIWSMVRHQIKF